MLDQLILVMLPVTLALAVLSMSNLKARRRRRAEAEAADLDRLTGYFRKIKPKNAGPAIMRDASGRVDVFRGLRHYAPTGKSRRGRRAR